MPEPVIHSTIVIERRFRAAPARVFAAWARPEAKARWMVCDDTWRRTELELDFRVGGVERHRTGPVGGPVHAFDGRFEDIVDGERIVYSYTMHVGDVKLSVSLATVELEPDGAGTRMRFTEQVAFLDGNDGTAEREEGTQVGFDRLAAAVAEP